MSERMTYRFGPLERRGLLGGVRGGQAFVLALAALAAVAVLNAAPTAKGAILATMLVGVGVAAGLIPMGRRTLDEWVPVVAVFAARGALGRHSFRSSLPTIGLRTVALGSRRIRLQPPSPQPPPCLDGVRMVGVRHGNRQIGVLSAADGRYLTAVLACRASAFGLLDADAQERRLARWGHVLAGAGSAPIRRLQWLERTAPAQGDELARWVHAERDPAIPLRGTAMIDSYLELIGSSAQVSREHEILLALQVDTGRTRSRSGDGGMGMLLEQVERVAQGLQAAEVVVMGVLGEAQLARALRTAFDPYARIELATLETADPDHRGLPDTSTWPLAAEESWEQYHSDGAFHTTYWIGSWPRAAVSPMFLDPLLGRSSAVRTVAVTFEPLAPERSIREAEAAVTRDRADRELRRRFGQSHTARQQQSEEATLRREAELAAGHAEVRMAGFVTVSGRDPDELRQACREVIEQAARARLELHCMYGQQADAFTFTLPLCRGLR